jgi:hypothetical protein
MFAVFSIEWIEEADACRVTGRVFVCRVKTPEDGKGRRLPLIVNGINVIRPTASPSSIERNSKLVGVDRATRATLDTQVDPEIQEFGVTSPELRTPSAVFIWQLRQNAWLLIGPSPSAALCGVVKNVSPSSSFSRSWEVVSG